MNYYIFTMPLTYPRFETALNWHTGTIPKGYTKVPPVRDDYASKDLYGLYNEDDWNAEVHAYQTIGILKERTDLTEVQKETLQHGLIQDIANFLHCLFSGLTKNQDRTVKKLIQIALSMDLGEELAEEIRKYYRIYIKEEDQNYGRYFVPAYEDLYRKAGDRALFLEENPEKAMLFYELADIDWFHLRDDQEEEEGLDEARRAGLEVWHETVLLYQRLMRGYFEKSDIVGESVEEKTCMEDFYEFLQARKQMVQLTIQEKADRFMENLRVLLEEETKTPDDLRTVMLMANILRRKAMLSGLYRLEKEKPSLSLQKAVLDCIRKVDGENLNLITEYARSSLKEKDLFHTVVLLAKMIVYTERIRRQLRIKTLEQDMAYYTSMETFFHMLPAEAREEDCGQLTVMNIAYMNDPNEGKILLRYLAGETLEQQDTGERRSASYPYVFMKCFTSRIDDLPMWEMYGNHAEGCCLVLDWENSNPDPERGATPLYRVCYVKKNKNSYTINNTDNPGIEDFNLLRSRLRGIKNAIRDLPDTARMRTMIRELLEDIAYLFKNSDYHYEKEVRILYRFTESSDRFCHTNGEYPRLYVKPDFPIQIKEIVIGPRFKNLAERMPYIQEQVERMCRLSHTYLPKITRSDIDYR